MQLFVIYVRMWANGHTVNDDQMNGSYLVVEEPGQLNSAVVVTSV